jgi:hypothetical protein
MLGGKNGSRKGISDEKFTTSRLWRTTSLQRMVREIWEILDHGDAHDEANGMVIVVMMMMIVVVMLGMMVTMVMLMIIKMLTMLVMVLVMMLRMVLVMMI